MPLMGQSTISMAIFKFANCSFTSMKSWFESLRSRTAMLTPLMPRTWPGHAAVCCFGLFEGPIKMGASWVIGIPPVIILFFDGLSIRNHLFCGTPIYGNPQILSNPLSNPTVDGCEILHHLGWNPRNHGINERFQLVQDFATIHRINS